MAVIDVMQLGPFPDWDQEPLDADYRMHRAFKPNDRAAVLDRHGDRIRAIATKGDIGASRALIEAMPALEMISVYGVGVDAIDLETCRARGISVANTPDVLTGDVADLAVAMILALDRGVIGADAWVRSGEWARQGSYPLQRRVHGRRAGILGLGRIGAAIAHRLAAFDMAIAYSARSPKDTAAQWLFVPDPVDLAARSDILVVALSATPGAPAVVDARVIDALGPEGMIVNISRAANVDEGALLDALESGRLRAAALDVFEGEPALDARFAALPNVILQPHQASGTVETRQAMGQLMRDNLAAHFEGWPLLTAVS